MNHASHFPVFRGKAQSFAALDFVEKSVRESASHLQSFSIYPTPYAVNPLLEARIAVMVQHWKGLATQVREEIRIFAHQAHEAREAAEESQMIDAFLTQVPRLSRKFRMQGPHISSDAPQAVHDSIREDDELVTETLARLHLKQGNKERAIGIYRQLILTFPEKSGYFADLIEQIS